MLTRKWNDIEDVIPAETHPTGSDRFQFHLVSSSVRVSKLELFRLASGPRLRLDTGYMEEDLIQAEFDPLLATLSAWGRSRQEALARLNRALTESAVIIHKGTSNKALLLDLLDRPEFEAHHVDSRWPARLSTEEEHPHKQYAVLALLQAAVEAYDAEFNASAAGGRPRVRQSADFPTHFRYLGLVYQLKVSRLGQEQYRVTMSGQSFDVGVERLGRVERQLTCFGRRYRTLSLVDGPDCYVEVEGIPHRITYEEGGLVRSPAPAVVVSVTVTPGDHVNAGDQLAIVETMKMEMAITAPFPGSVVHVFVRRNVQVDLGAPLIYIEPSEWVDTFADSELIPFVDAAPTAEALAPIRPAILTRPANAAGAAELSRSDNEANASTAAQSVRTSGVRFAQAGREENADTPQVRCRRIFEALRCQMLGYDSDPGDSRRLLGEQSAMYQLIEASDQALLQVEHELLSIFADICLLFRRALDPIEDNERGEQVHSAEHDLLAYLRSRDTRVELLPKVFVANLQQALAHYGVRGLEPSPALDESLLLMYKSHQHVNQHLDTITNFQGPVVFCVVSRYHGGSFVVFSKALNENLEVAAVAGSYASVIGGVPAAAVVFAREVDARIKSDPRVKELQQHLVQADETRKTALQGKLNEIITLVRSEKVGEVASEFDHIHTVERAQRVGSIDYVIQPAHIFVPISLKHWNVESSGNFSEPPGESPRLMLAPPSVPLKPVDPERPGVTLAV
jgi:biotin carboxyl carrier protein